MAKRLTRAERRAALRKGAGGRKAGLWRNVWRKRGRALRRSAQKK